MSEARTLWAELVRPASLLTRADGLLPDANGPPTSRTRVVDVAACVIAALLGALFLSPALHDPGIQLSRVRVDADIVLGVLACAMLWWRRSRPVAVALGCLLLGTLSISATAPGLLALCSLAAHRPIRPVLLVAALWIPSCVVFGVYSPTTDPVSVVLLVTPLALAAAAIGMFVRARRQLLFTLRERAERAETGQREHEDRARMAERTRIAREMHDVLAHRISLLALHAGALEVRPDLPAETVRETAGLLRSTARQALEELRGVIGLLREGPDDEWAAASPPPTLADVRRLVEQTRRAGADIDFEIHVDQAGAMPDALGRDAYRIVQEALTNIGKHAGGTATRVRVSGAPARGLHVSVRNRQPVHAPAGPALPGSGAGLLGLQERVALAGGTLVHGPDGTGDFVVEAEFRW